MPLRPDEVTGILRERLKAFEDRPDRQEVGTVVQAGDGQLIASAGVPVRTLRELRTRLLICVGTILAAMALSQSGDMVITTEKEMLALSRQSSSLTR